MGDPRGRLARFGYLAMAAVVSGVLAAGLPVGMGRRALMIVLLVIAVAGWLVALSRRWVGWSYALVVVVTGVAGAALSLLQPDGPAFVIGYMALAALALRLRWRAAFAAATVVLISIGYAQVVTSTRPGDALLGVALGAGFVFAAGSLAAVSRQAREMAEALLVEQQATQAAREQAAALGERTRLARELHDVLAHTLSGLAVQLEGARLLAEHTGADPRLAEQVMRAHGLARDGMGNAKRAVSALRGDAIPGPAMLAELVDQVQTTRGMPVTLTVTGTVRTLPPEAGLAVYRTVQEALTNSGKYAGPGACAMVSVVWSDRDVQVEIVDRTGLRTSPRPTGSDADTVDSDRRADADRSGGFGLAGLAERAALLGGNVTAGPIDSGFRVHLRLPLQSPSAKEQT